MKRLALSLLLAGASAHADASAPAPVEPISFAGRLIDARGAKLISAGADKCPDILEFPHARAMAESGRAPSTSPRSTEQIQRTARHILFSSRWHLPGAPESTVLDLRTNREVMRVDRRLTSLVEDARGELIGAVAVDGSARAISFVPTAGRGGWTTALRDPTRGPLSGDGSAALLDGDRIVVAPFDTAGEGMQLYALDRATGRLLWRGEVDQFNYPHSVYLHDVRLAARGDRIVLESVEAAGCSLQLFEPATGKRMFVSTVDQWARRK